MMELYFCGGLDGESSGSSVESKDRWDLSSLSDDGCVGGGQLNKNNLFRHEIDRA